MKQYTINSIDDFNDWGKEVLRQNGNRYTVNIRLCAVAIRAVTRGF
jgi:hypothetical protein